MFQLNYRKKEKQEKLNVKRHTRKISSRSSFDTNSYMNVENLLTYPHGPVSLALSCSDGTIRKTRKSKLYEAAMYDLSIVE